MKFHSFQNCIDQMSFQEGNQYHQIHIDLWNELIVPLKTKKKKSEYLYCKIPDSQFFSYSKCYWSEVRNYKVTVNTKKTQKHTILELRAKKLSR